MSRAAGANRAGLVDSATDHAPAPRASRLARATRSRATARAGDGDHLRRAGGADGEGVHQPQARRRDTALRSTAARTQRSRLGLTPRGNAAGRPAPAFALLT